MIAADPTRERRKAGVPQNNGVTQEGLDMAGMDPLNDSMNIEITYCVE